MGYPVHAVNIAVIAASTAAFVLLFGLTFGFGAALGRARWWLLWLLGSLITIPLYLLAVHAAANWNNPRGLTQMWVDPGPTHKLAPLLAAALGALAGGSLTRRRRRAH